ncbi:MAG: GTPase Era [Candidatus Symbiobacter sp.]|nr:GTPase Era [Candidatus Symbiobacter sp.]
MNDSLRLNSHVGYIALIGRPNAGKSTLLNQLIGQKISIVSPKVQTTRNRILGLVMARQETAQIIFIDTPGIFDTAKKPMERQMVDQARQGAIDADFVLLVLDATRQFGRHGNKNAPCQLAEGDRRLIEQLLTHKSGKIMVAINKIDAVPPARLLPLLAELKQLLSPLEIYLVSAQSGENVSAMRESLAGYLPAGEFLYPPDQLADIPMRFLAAEFTREQCFLHLYDELPYSLMVETESWEEFRNGDLRLKQQITVERPGQRAILLGHQGQMIKRIGQAARLAMAAEFDRTVHLSLHVRVRAHGVILNDPVG